MSQLSDFAIGIPEADSGNRTLFRDSVLWSLLAALLGLLGSFALYARLEPARSQRQLTACKSNCKIIATALEMYASGPDGHYPPSLVYLTEGKYLKELPTCPAAGRMTYTNYQRTQTPDSFSFSCVGNHHARAYRGFCTSSDNYPRYSSESSVEDYP